MSRLIHIDVYFDFICPWCLIGKRQLEVAIQLLQQSDPDVEVKLQWKGVQLLTEIPEEGVPFQAFYLKRLGSITAVRMRQNQVRQAAKAVCLEINFDRIQRMPNTRKAHHLIKHIETKGDLMLRNRLLEGIFSAYFLHSEDIGDVTVLKRIAAYLGENEEELNNISNTTTTPFLSANTGGKGVPYFVFDKSFAIAGAQSADVLYQAMLEVLATQGQAV